MILKFFVLALLLSVYISTDNVESYDLNNYRLPTWAFPDKYYLTIDLRWPEADTFRAYTWIDINVTEENHYELVLNVDPDYIDVNSSDITVDTAHFICDTFDYSYKTQIMVLTCMWDMWGNDTRFAQLEMHYTAKFSSDSGGLSKYNFEINGTSKSVIFSDFEPTLFRRVFPSFDEPCFKAPVRLHVDHYANLTVASNTVELEDVNEPYRFIESTFDVTPSMSTYLVAVVAGSSIDWQHTLISGSNNFYLFMQRVHEDYVSITRKNAPVLLQEMGDWTDIKYEDLGNPKMTFAALPGMGGAMENWGLITFAEAYLVDEGDRTTTKSLIRSLPVMAHELSHQWFGDYVTLNWWSEAWLNEGFATYFEFYLADMLSSDDNNYEFENLFITKELQVALQADGPNALPLSNNDSNVNTAEEIVAYFGDITYCKGGSVIRMLRYALGEEIFQKGMQSYLKAKALSNAKASDVLENLQAALPSSTDIDLPAYMNSWIYQPDYPIVKTTWSDGDADNYVITLNIYKHSPSLNENSEQDESIWWVPISYITGNNPDPNKATYSWIGPGQTYEIKVPKDVEDNAWGVVNAGATGFYRVDYDTETLMRITNVLNNADTYKNIATRNRAQLLDDLFNVAKYSVMSEGNNERPYKDALTVAGYLKHETEYIPWFSYLKEVQYLLDAIQDGPTIQKLKDDVLDLIKAQLVIPDPTNTTKLPHSEILKRNLLLEWACKLEDEDALAYVKTQFPKFLEDTKSIDSNYRDVVVCYGLQTSDDQTKDYATLTKLYSQSILPQEQYDITLGMTCMSQSDLLKSYLASTVTLSPPIIDKQFWKGIFTAYLRSSEGLDAAIYFVVNHIDGITEKWKRAMKIAEVLSGLASNIFKSGQIKMLQDLLLQSSLNPAQIKAIKQAIKKAEYNVDWINKRGSELTSSVVG